MAVTGRYTKRFFILLEIPHSETDATHRMTQTALGESLCARGQNASRKTIRHILTDLQEAGYPVRYDHGWYYEHLLSQSELIYLTDMVRGSQVLNPEDQERLLGKLHALGGKHFDLQEMPVQGFAQRPDVLTNLLMLHEAIHSRKQIEFRYGDYGIDQMLHPRKRHADFVKEYLASPYDVVFVNGRFYLIALINKYRELSHYRIDRMVDLRIRRAARIPLQAISGQGSCLDLSQYVHQHPYMYAGSVAKYSIPVKASACTDILDTFGNDTVFTQDADGKLYAHVISEKQGLSYWLKRYEYHLIEGIRPVEEYLET